MYLISIDNIIFIYSIEIILGNIIKMIPDINKNIMDNNSKV